MLNQCRVSLRRSRGRKARQSKTRKLGINTRRSKSAYSASVMRIQGVTTSRITLQLLSDFISKQVILNTIFTAKSTCKRDSGIDIASTGSHRTPLRLQRYRLYPALHHPKSYIMQTRQSTRHVQSNTIRLPAAPKHLGGTSYTRPCDRIEILRGALFGP